MKGLEARFFFLSFWLLGLLPLVGQGGLEAQRGVLRLLGEEEAVKQEIVLDGEWQLYWDELIRHPQESEQEPLMWPLDGRWSKLPDWPGFPHEYGYGTYVLEIESERVRSDLGLWLPLVYSAHALYLNGKLIARNGQVAASFDLAQPFWLPQVKPLALRKGSNYLVLQISNWHHHKGGGYQAPVLGSYQKLNALHRVSENASLFLAGALLIIALFALIAFYFQQKSWAFIFLSLFSISYIYRIIGTDTYVLHALLPGLDWQWTLRLEYLSLFASISFYTYFFRHLLVPKAPLWLFHLVAGISAFKSLLLLLPSAVFTTFIDYYLIVIGFLALVIVAFYLPAIRWRHSMSWFTSISVASLFFLFVIKLVEHFLGGSQQLLMVFSAYLIFLISTTVSVSMRFGYNLRQESSRGENAEEGQRNFMNSISHELRTPMNAILGMSEWLSNSELKSDQRNKLEVLRKNAGELNDILLDMLNFSQAEKGSLRLDKRKFEPTEIFDKAVEKAKKFKGDRKITFNYHYDKNIPQELVGDPDKLIQVVTHVLGNAFKFTEKGQVSLELNCTAIEKQKVALQMIVEDTGVGIRKGELEKVMKAFQQAEGGNTRKHGGAGLGLSLASRIIELMDGELWIDSVYGKGTVVECHFNLSTPAQDLSDATAAVKASNQKLNPQLKILYAEDNPVNQKLLAMMLKTMGYDIDLADDGLQAWEMAISKRYHVIFMDIQMPKMDGIESTRRILKDNTHRPVVIALTANANAAERERCSEVGMNDFIPKPFNAKIIKEALAKWQGTISFLADDTRDVNLEHFS